jgi:ribose-phosphate pyrophosphokinase
MQRNLMLFSGNANLAFAKAVAERLQNKLGAANIAKFSDGESSVELPVLLPMII